MAASVVVIVVDVTPNIALPADPIAGTTVDPLITKSGLILTSEWNATLVVIMVITQRVVLRRLKMNQKIGPIVNGVERQDQYLKSPTIESNVRHSSVQLNNNSYFHSILSSGNQKLKASILRYTGAVTIYYHLKHFACLGKIVLRLRQFSQVSFIQYMGLCVFSLPISPVMIVRMCSLSYYQHQIGSMNHKPLFRVRSWNNGMRCMSYYVLS